MILDKFKTWLIHKLGGATPIEPSTILCGYVSHPVQFERTEYPIRTLCCEIISPNFEIVSPALLQSWNVNERDRYLCEKLVEELMKSDCVEISETPMSSSQSVIRATIRVVSLDNNEMHK